MTPEPTDPPLSGAEVILYREREACEPEMVARCASLDAAQALVYDAELAGEWPEGWDAVALDAQGDWWCLGDQWWPVD